MNVNGLYLPAERWPYDPLAAEDPLDPLTKDTKQGENRIMELMSKESEYGEHESAEMHKFRQIF